MLFVMLGIGEPVVVPLRHLARARASRTLAAVGVVAAWLALFLAELILSVMFFSEPHPEILLYTSPMLLAVPVILGGLRRGRLLVHHDVLALHYPRMLRRPLVLDRLHVERVLLDDGSATGRARFATGDPSRPLLWTEAVALRQHDRRPLFGDQDLPNLAIVLRTPIPLDAARNPWVTITMAGEMEPPRPSGEADAILLTVESLEDARLALTGWQVEQPDVSGVIPAEVAVAARRVPQDAAIFVVLAFLGAIGLVGGMWPLFPLFMGLSMWWAVGMVRRRQAQEAAARAALDDRLMSPADRATATAAIDANFRRSVGPPGF